MASRVPGIVYDALLKKANLLIQQTQSTDSQSIRKRSPTPLVKLHPCRPTGNTDLIFGASPLANLDSPWILLLQYVRHRRSTQPPTWRSLGGGSSVESNPRVNAFMLSSKASSLFSWYGMRRTNQTIQATREQPSRMDAPL